MGPYFLLLLPDQVNSADPIGHFKVTGMDRALLVSEAPSHLMVSAWKVHYMLDMAWREATRRGGANYLLDAAATRCAPQHLTLLGRQPSAAPKDLALTSTPSAWGGRACNPGGTKAARPPA
jgi:hypothetical protein